MASRILGRLLAGYAVLRALRRLGQAEPPSPADIAAAAVKQFQAFQAARHDLLREFGETHGDDDSDDSE